MYMKGNDRFVRINQEELGYLEDEYEDLKALFQMFDFDQVSPISNCFFRHHLRVFLRTEW